MINKYYRKINLKILATLCVFIFQILLFSQPSSDMSQAKGLNYSKNSDRYITDDRGNILIHVNVWGHVKNPGHHLVYDGIDISTLLSVVGGPLPGANLKKVKLLREQKDKDGEIMFELNLKDFYESGDRSSFKKIYPNDTIIIEEKAWSSIYRQNNIINSILQILNIAILIIQNQP